MSKKFIYNKPRFDIDLRLAKAAIEGENRLVLKLTEHKDCDHGVVFGEEEYKKHPNMTSAEVKKRWPRGWGLCPKGCGYEGIACASFLHYIAGDW